jgi:hypothetical protein
MDHQFLRTEHVSLRWLYEDVARTEDGFWRFSANASIGLEQAQKAPDRIASLWTTRESHCSTNQRDM